MQAAEDQLEIEKAISTAILARTQLEIDYRGKANAQGVRVVNPHALYRTGNDKLYLHAYQVDGVSDSGEIPAWRQFELTEIASLKPLGSDFELEGDYDPSSSRYSAGLLVAAS